MIKIAGTSFKYETGPSWIGNMRPANLQKSACFSDVESKYKI